MATVYLALGSNIGDSRKYISTAIDLLGKSVHDIKEAPVYSAKAVVYAEQPDFLNTAIRGETSLSPEQLLNFVKKVEEEAGRKFSFRFGPRQIDIDIILYDDLVMDTDDLTIPHRAFTAREFVLKPLADLDPDLKDPVTGQTMTQLLAKLKPANKSIIKQVD